MRGLIGSRALWAAGGGRQVGLKRGGVEVVQAVLTRQNEMVWNRNRSEVVSAGLRSRRHQGPAGSVCEAARAAKPEPELWWQSMGPTGWASRILSTQQLGHQPRRGWEQGSTTSECAVFEDRIRRRWLADHPCHIGADRSDQAAATERHLHRRGLNQRAPVGFTLTAEIRADRRCRKRDGQQHRRETAGAGAC